MITRPKPLCLITISGLHVDHLLESSASNLKSLVDTYPFLILSSNKRNVNNWQDSYIELGTGVQISEENRVALAQVISDASLSQLHLADTESYAYLTYFFNNQNKFRHEAEDWFKKSTLKVDFTQEDFNMTSKGLTRKLIKEINKQSYDFIVVNYHDLIKSINHKKILESLDKNIKSIVDIVLSFNGVVLITASSSFKSLDNRVPFILVGKQWKNKSHIDYDYQKNINEQTISGDIIQIAPTILKILGLSKPREIKTDSLI